MKEYDRSKPLISIHVPKCAGTSFTHVLRKWFKRRLYSHYFDEKNGRMPKKYNLKSLNGGFKKGVCIHGHFNKERGFGVQDYYPEVDQFITVLRDPFEVALSNYFFVRKLESRNALYRDGKAGKQTKTLEEYLSGHRPYILNFFPFEMTLKDYREKIDKYFIHMGVAEDLQGSVNKLSEKLGFLPVKVEVKNVSERDQEPPESFRKDYRERHPLEYAVYEYAQELNKR